MCKQATASTYTMCKQALPITTDHPNGHSICPTNVKFHNYKIFPFWTTLMFWGTGRVQWMTEGQNTMQAPSFSDNQLMECSISSHALCVHHKNPGPFSSFLKHDLLDLSKASDVWSQKAWKLKAWPPAKSQGRRASRVSTSSLVK